MRVIALVYDWPHKKTCDGLLRLAINNINVDCVIAAPKIELPIPERILRVTEKDIDYEHPKKIAEKFGWNYIRAPHTATVIEYLKDRHNLKPQLGVILGARILPKEVIGLFSMGILNMHPGILPQNRGLDTIEWAALRGIPQGVTTHLIDEQIDRGILIDRQQITTYEDDSPVDIWLRLMSLQMTMMIEALQKLDKPNRLTYKLGVGQYHSYMDTEKQEKVAEIFSSKMITA